MKFKILPLLLASVVGINSFAQSPARLSAFSVKVQSGSTTNVLDTVKYSYFSTHGGVPFVDAFFIRQLSPDYLYNRPVNYRGIVNLTNLEFSHEQNHKTNMLQGTVPFYKETKTYTSAGLPEKHEQFVDTNFYWYQPLQPGTRKVVTSYTYTTTGNLLKKLVEYQDVVGATITLDVDSFAYNTGGMLVHVYKYKGGGLAWATDFFFTGNLLDSVYDMYSKRYYTYSGTNIVSYREDFNSMNYGYRNDTKFNIVGLPIQDSTTVINKGVASPLSKYTYHYNSNGDIILSDYWPYTGGVPDTLTSRMCFYMSYDANHNMLSLHVRSTGFTDTAYHDRHEFTYNSLNLVEKYVQKNWDSASASWIAPTVDTQRYYYYSNIAGVDKTPAQQLQCTLYPVPANAMLNIDISNGKENETAFEVYSTDGRLVRRMVVKTQANGKYAIPVADLSAGTYILHAKCGELENVKQFAVLR